MDMKNVYTPVVVGVAVGLIVGFAAGWYWTENKYTQKKVEVQTGVDTNDDSMLVEEADDSSTMETSAKNEAISVSSQEAGDTVLISQATVSEPGWVAVREMVAGQMGNILGATRIKEAGVVSNVEVKLLRPTVSGGTYAVVIYRDNGDGDFDFNFDSLVVKGGSAVSSTFQAE